MYYNIGMALGWSNQNNLVLSVLYQDNHQIYNRLKQTYMINKEETIARHKPVAGQIGPKQNRPQVKSALGQIVDTGIIPDRRTRN
jgi:hypothetical protein